MKNQVRVEAKRGRSDKHATRSRKSASADKHSTKQSVHTKAIQISNKTPPEEAFDTKAFQEKVRDLFLTKQTYKPPVFDPKLAHAFALAKKADAELQKPEKVVLDAGDALNSQLLPEKTGIPFEFRVPEFCNRMRCSDEVTDVVSSPKATRQLLVVCPRVPPIMRLLGTDQATLNLSCQTDGLPEYIELRQGELMPGLYVNVQVPDGVALKFAYCVRLNDGQVVATDEAVQLAPDAGREAYYIMPKLVPIASLEHVLGIEDASVEEETPGDTTTEKKRRAGLMRRLLVAVRRLLKR